jgi:hypothetical protein
MGANIIKWTKKMLQNMKTIVCLVKHLKEVAKCCLDFYFIFMLTSFVVVSAQVWKSKMRSSKLIMKSNAQKQMGIFDFGCKFHDLNHFELFFSIP